jgi:hypothetical protein
MVEIWRLADTKIGLSARGAKVVKTLLTSLKGGIIYFQINDIQSPFHGI